MVIVTRRVWRAKRGGRGLERGPGRGLVGLTSPTGLHWIRGLYLNLLRDAIELPLALGRVSMWAWIEIDFNRLLPSISNLILRESNDKAELSPTSPSQQLNCRQPCPAVVFCAERWPIFFFHAASSLFVSYLTNQFSPCLCCLWPRRISLLWLYLSIRTEGHEERCPIRVGHWCHTRATFTHE